MQREKNDVDLGLSTATSWRQLSLTDISLEWTNDDEQDQPTSRSLLYSNANLFFCSSWVKLLT